MLQEWKEWQLLQEWKEWQLLQEWKEWQERQELQQEQPEQRHKGVVQVLKDRKSTKTNHANPDANSITILDPILFLVHKLINIVTIRL